MFNDVYTLTIFVCSLLTEHQIVCDLPLAKIPEAYTTKHCGAAFCRGASSRNKSNKWWIAIGQGYFLLGLRSQDVTAVVNVRDLTKFTKRKRRLYISCSHGESIVGK